MNAGSTAEIIDFNQLTKSMVRSLNPRIGDVSSVYDAFDILRGLPFPPGYVDSLRGDVLKVLRAGMPSKPTFVYLAFYGVNNKATHLKIGVAKNVKARLSGIKTGNPLPNLWTFTAGYSTRGDALAVEAALIAHMSANSVHGEWVSVGSIAECAAASIVESLADVAATVSECRIRFQLEGV